MPKPRTPRARFEAKKISPGGSTSVAETLPNSPQSWDSVPTPAHHRLLSQSSLFVERTRRRGLGARERCSSGTLSFPLAQPRKP